MPDGTLYVYGDFALFGESTWEATDDSTITTTFSDGSKQDVSATLEKRSGYDYLIVVDETGTLIFFLDSIGNFMMDDDNGSTSQSTDEQLTAAIEDVTWYFVYYSDSDGVITDFNTASYLYKSDGTYEEIFEGDSYYGTWYLEDGKVWLEYDDSTRFVWAVEFETEAGKLPGDCHHLSRES